MKVSVTLVINKVNNLLFKINYKTKSEKTMINISCSFQLLKKKMKSLKGHHLVKSSISQRFQGLYEMMNSLNL